MTRRADRLFALLQQLRGGKVWTAQKLAEALEVSERTIYRDIADLQANAVPIDGAAGVGYRLQPGFELPPLMFTRDEIEALVIGARLARAVVGDALVPSIDRALAKIETVLPKERRRDLQRPKVFAPAPVVEKAVQDTLHQLRMAIDTRHVAHVRYTREDGEQSERDLLPLGLYFWGKTWTLVAWCEMRDDFRHFRLDRINALTLSARTFVDEPGRTLQDFLRGIGVEQDV